MKALTSGVPHVGAVSIPSWGSRNPLKQWLETITDMALRPSQRRSCTRNLSSSVSSFNLLFCS